jgi:uncharacterized protein (TIGR00251 family)
VGDESDAHLVAVRVIPRARRDEVGGERAGRLVVRTTAAPVDGRANDAVRRLLADHFGVATRDIEVVVGQRSRDKTVRVSRRP